MKKNLILGMFAAMLLSTSCTNEELSTSLSENEAQVSFKLGLEGGMATRAISDGTGADRLVYAVFDENGNRISTIAAVDKTTSFPTTESITLAKGQTYKIAFWAQDSDCDAYTVNTNDMTVAINYNADINNDETRDAFFKAIEFTVTSSTSIDVELKRPFAQINVGVYQDDWDAAVASGIEIKKSSVVIKNAATSINLLTGAVGEETTDVEVSYVSEAIPAEEFTVDVNKDGDFEDENEKYVWLSMSYILVADHDTTADENGLLGNDRATLQELQYTFTPNSGNPIVFTEGLTSVPVQRNWRTNILGKILTGDIQFNISIDPAYEDDILFP